VLAGELELRELVIERLAVEASPLVDRVALLAVGGELAGVRILVAAGARVARADELRARSAARSWCGT